MRIPALSPSGQWRLFGAVWLAVAVVAVLAADGLARRDAGISAGRQARTAAALHGAVLKSELERQQAVPYVLAADPDVLTLLAAPTPERRDRLNRKFETLAQEVRAAVIYVLDADGTALAASNWNEPISFVGSNYRFRPYFYEAVRDGRAAFFALGTVSGRPGLYMSRRIDRPDGGVLGVVVAKVEFDALEAAWRASNEPTYVVDADGVVLITTSPDWRFRATRPLSQDRRRRLAEDQTAGATLYDLPFSPPPSGFLRMDDGGGSHLYAHAADHGMGLGWTLHLLWPADQVVTRAVGAARILAILSIALLAALTGVLLRRRQRARIRADQEEAARAELEQKVEQRTAQLSAANARLSQEIDERRRLEEARQTLEDDLIQANKLATLGQIAAGVAHEINQPLAAIRTHADSAGLYLERGEAGSAERSLKTIADLTHRVGIITDELRAFSRRARSGVVDVEVEDALDGALLLVAARLREKGVTVRRTSGDRALKVRAERIRLEQVILNLLQNAIEALDAAPEPELQITVAARGRKVVIRIADNGPGLSDAVRDRLFTPFTTDKPKGVGLGLVISRDIVAGFGGELLHEPTTAGAAFRIVLARAK